jgi:predicted HAD superfamily Cof-like phosphohydrolase
MMHLLTAVQDFHRKMNVDHKDGFHHTHDESLAELEMVLGFSAEVILQDFKRDMADVRYLRLHLILEEVAELIGCFAKQDAVGVADALGDLMYVTLGTAVTFDIPLEKIFNEIHRSNMSKEPQESDPDKARVRDKGPNYSPPNLAEIMRNHGFDIPSKPTTPAD